ncbi:MAG TPA: hypothetical protein VF381_14295 [Thermoanaerobaculia bacterium]
MLLIAALAIAVAACRGEKVPRDYQNEPPAMTHPVNSSTQTPTAHGMPGPAAETSTAAEGKTTKPVGPSPAAPKTPVPDTKPGLPPNAVTTMTPPGQAATTTHT